MTRIGVVCEGSHDFIVLSAFVKAAMKPVVVNVLPIQPAIDATMRQDGDGGFHHVKAWCLRNSGKSFYQNIGTGLFDGSTAYDHILVHLDGDVVEKTDWFTTQEIATAKSGVRQRCSIVRKWIENSLAFGGGDELCSAIPVFTTDAWVLATIRPNRSFEHVEFKNRLTLYLSKFFGASRRKSLQLISPHCATNLEKARTHNESIDDFLSDLP